MFNGSTAGREGGFDLCRSERDIRLERLDTLHCSAMKAATWSLTVRASVRGDFEIPAQAVVEFELSWKSKPDFVFALGVDENDDEQVYKQAPIDSRSGTKSW